MSPNPTLNQSSEDNGSSSELPEGTSPLPMPETLNSATATETPVRTSQIGEGSYEGTRGYANSVKAYMGTANVSQDAKAAAPHSAIEARELLDAESEAASHSKAPGK